MFNIYILNRSIVRRKNAWKERKKCISWRTGCLNLCGKSVGYSNKEKEEMVGLVAGVCVRCPRLLDGGTVAEVCAADALKRRAPRIICSKAAVSIVNMWKGLQRDVIYLCWPIAPSYTSPNGGGKGRGGRLQGLSQWVQLCTLSPNKL